MGVPSYFVEPGHIPMVLLTPEKYDQLKAQHGPNLWPVYFGARMAAQTIQDLLMRKLQTDNISEIQARIPDLLAESFSAAEAQYKAGPEGEVSLLKADLERLYSGLYDNWKAGIWQGMGAAYSNAMDNFLSTGQLLYAYKTLMYHTAITPRMRRHWMKTFTPMVPDASMAWILLKRGHINERQFDTYAGYDGWDAEGIKFLKAAWSQVPNVYSAFNLLMRGQITESEYAGYVSLHSWPEGWDSKLYSLFQRLPTPHEAFYMWAKGDIKGEERDELYKAGGYDAAWHDVITKNWQYTLTLYDLTRIADYVELDQIWAIDQMRRRGVKDQDIAKIWEMLEIRPLREEIRALTAKLTWRYMYGRAIIFDPPDWSTDALNDELTELGVKTKERELLIEKAELDYEDELVDEWIDIYRWRFRTAVISEQQFLDELTDPQGNCRIRTEKANLIVEAEVARGYMGYY